MGANGGFFDETLDVAKVCAYNEAKIAAGGNVEPDAFENPTSANVVRFCDVGEKEIVRLRYAAPTAETTAPTLGAPSILRERRNAFLARKRVSAFLRSFGSVA
ncbi:MAG: hypothetical protein IJO40_05760, partial [Thermoguttaceae bacterium]|nr:hypothetical protein [Thermoguttaceae bacterium]